MLFPVRVVYDCTSCSRRLRDKSGPLGPPVHYYCPGLSQNASYSSTPNEPLFNAPRPSISQVSPWYYQTPTRVRSAVLYTPPTSPAHTAHPSPAPRPLGNLKKRQRRATTKHLRARALLARYRGAEQPPEPAAAEGDGGAAARRRVERACAFPGRLPPPRTSGRQGGGGARCCEPQEQLQVRERGGGGHGRGEGARCLFSRSGACGRRFV